jgi:hypothetical protein
LADVPLTEEDEGTNDEFRTPTDEEQRVHVRYKLGSGQVRLDKMTPYDKADSEKQKLILREAVVANIVIGNKRRVCLEKGIPIEVFERVWDEYHHETNTFHGRFFHRQEIPSKDKDNDIRMKAAIAEYHANGNKTRAVGRKKGDKQEVWHKHNVARTTFYDAINWEDKNPGKKWDEERMRARGKVSLLTYDMETELLHWIAVSQKHSGGVDMHSVCRVAFALMASDPEHHKNVKEVSPYPNPYPHPHPHPHLHGSFYLHPHDSFCTFFVVFYPRSPPLLCSIRRTQQRLRTRIEDFFLRCANPNPHLYPDPHPIPNPKPDPNPKLNPIPRAHAEYRDVNKRAFSNRWFHRFKKRFPACLTKHTVESYAVGRAKITRTMIDTIYSVLKTVLDAAEHPIPASNIWNFDETGHKTKYIESFLYGLRSATKNNAESCGLGEHVTVGACANLKGFFLDPILLFTGAESKMEASVRAVGFKNALSLFKRGKASMDDRLLSIFWDWFGNA